MDKMIVNGLVGLVLIGLSFPLHEACHWLPSKIYKLHTEVALLRKDWTFAVAFDDATPVQREVILLAPLSVDMILLFCALLFLFNFPDPSWYLVLVPLSIGWGCFNSLHDIWELKRREPK